MKRDWMDSSLPPVLHRRSFIYSSATTDDSMPSADPRSPARSERLVCLLSPPPLTHSRPTEPDSHLHLLFSLFFFLLQAHESSRPETEVRRPPPLVRPRSHLRNIPRWGVPLGGIKGEWVDGGPEGRRGLRHGVQRLLLPGHQLHAPEQRTLPARQGGLQGTHVSLHTRRFTGKRDLLFEFVTICSL